MIWMDIDRKPFEIRGLAHIDREAGKYYRLPPEVIDTISEKVSILARQSAGGRIRFRTNATQLKLRYRVADKTASYIMSTTANSFASVYIDGAFDGSLAVTCLQNEEYIEYTSFEGHLEGKWHDIMVYLPMHDRLLSMQVGVDEEARVAKARPYTYEKPIVFYGSSITQGLTACHPGISYVDQTCRRLDTDYKNLGFSGSALGEAAIAEYIASLDMSIFVMDYDHNAPTPEHLRDTHERFYGIVRKKHPDTPIVMISKPNVRPWLAADYERKEIIKATYDRAIARGDKNVYFIDGESFFGEAPGRFDCTSDGTHPNDLGMTKMADCITPVLRKILTTAQ